MLQVRYSLNTCNAAYRSCSEIADFRQTKKKQINSTVAEFREFTGEIKQTTAENANSTAVEFMGEIKQTTAANFRGACKKYKMPERNGNRCRVHKWNVSR